METILTHTSFAIPWALTQEKKQDWIHSTGHAFSLFSKTDRGYARLDVNEKVTGVILRVEKLFEKKCNQIATKV